MKTLMISGAALIASLVDAPAFAAEDLTAYISLKGSEVRVAASGAYSNAVLSVSGPEGFYAKDFSKAGNPTVDLIKSGARADGVYDYEVSAASQDMIPVYGKENNGRGSAERGEINRGASARGSFLVKGGLIVDTSRDVEK